jgi:hypothetical protein
MDKMITREEALEILKYNSNVIHQTTTGITDTKEVEALDMAIKALEQEPKTGHWIEHSHEWGDNWEYSMYECSCCHNWAHEDTDYCPNCGAEMEEVKV